MAKSKKAAKELLSEEILVGQPTQHVDSQIVTPRVYGFELGDTIWIGRYVFDVVEGDATLDDYVRVSKIPVNDFKPFTFTEKGKEWLDSIPDDKISIDGDIISVNVKV